MSKRTVRYYVHIIDGLAYPTKTVYGSWLVRFLPFMPRYGLTLRDDLVLFRHALGKVKRRDLVHEARHQKQVHDRYLETPGWIVENIKYGPQLEQEAQDVERAFISQKRLPGMTLELDPRAIEDTPNI